MATFRIIIFILAAFALGNIFQISLRDNVVNDEQSFWSFDCKDVNGTLVCRTGNDDVVNIHCPQGITITATISNVPEDKRDDIPDLLCSQVIATIWDRERQP